MNTGLTTFGIIRKRMSELLSDFNERIKAGGAFGPTTTLDDPDKYAGDALVQIATASSASVAELWEANEFIFNQLDYRVAEGRFLERLHGIPKLGIKKDPAESWELYRAKILDLFETRANRSDPSVVATKHTGVICARQVFSTLQAPVEGIPAGGTMLVVRGCGVDYSSLAAQLYSETELGIYSWFGDELVNHPTDNNGCLSFRFQPAVQIFVNVEIRGYFEATRCEGSVTQASVEAEAVAKLNAAYETCDFGQQLTSGQLTSQLSGLNGFIVTGVVMRRRAKRLYAANCVIPDQPMFDDCGTPVPWATHNACGVFAAGEVWCTDFAACLQLNPWEYPAFHTHFAFVNVLEPQEC